MLTRKQRNQIPIGIERFKTDHRARDIEQGELNVIDTAMALWEAMNNTGSIAGQWELLTRLDYDCYALDQARIRMDEIPEIPSWVEGIPYDATQEC